MAESSSPRSNERVVEPAIESHAGNHFAGRYAICDATGLVLNTIKWNGVSPWSPPPGCVARHDPHGGAAPGGRWLGGGVDGDRFAPPEPGAPPVRAELAPDPRDARITELEARLAALEAKIAAAPQ